METGPCLNVETNFQKLLELEPKLVSYTVPENANEEKALFLRGERYIPNHSYPKLSVAPERYETIRIVGEDIILDPSLRTQHKKAYRDFVNSYMKKTQLLGLMDAVKREENQSDREAAKQAFMELNIELYGSPDKETYTSLLQEKINILKKKELSSSADAIRDELFSMLDIAYINESQKAERFKPSEKTTAWIKTIAETIYGTWLARIPEQERFSEQELQAVFTDILRNEFDESADDWRVDIEPAKSINVKAAEKRVVIPEDRGELAYDTVRKLVVHEIGVHVLRAVTGEQTDLGPLRTGLNEYYDAEEGLGKVMEQALSGTYEESGIDHYITAGASYIDGKDFRETFEMKWRLSLLQKIKDNEDVSDRIVADAKNSAYGGVMRMFRGTDELPWFKDLAYYNGTAETWKFLEKIEGDDFRLTLLLMGKINTSQAHLQTVLETASA